MSNKLYSGYNETSNVVNSFIKLVGILVLTGVSIVLLYFYSAFSIGYVGMNLWTWFIIPVFGVPSLSWGQSYGIALVFSLYSYRVNFQTNKDEREKHEKIGHLIGILLIPWVFLFAGWIGKTFFL